MLVHSFPLLVMIFMCSLLAERVIFCNAEELSSKGVVRRRYRYDNKHAFAGITVPFFLYSGGDFDVFWNACRKPIFAKGVEVSFLLHLQNHPWRTHDPEEAAVFVIPGLFSVSLHWSGSESRCTQPLEEMSVTLADAVQKSPWFKRHGGRDHLMTIGYYKAEQFIKSAMEWKGVLNQTTLALHSGDKRFIGVTTSRCVISVGHHAISTNSETYVKGVNSGDEVVNTRPLPQSLLDIQEKNSFKPQPRSIFMLGLVSSKMFYRNRVTAVRSLGNVGVNSFFASKCVLDYNFTRCDEVKDDLIVPVSNCCFKNGLPYASFVKQMMMSNFSLLIRGGDAGTSRFADALALSIPQLVLSDDFYSGYVPFPCTVPWREITEQIREKEFKRNPQKATQEALDRATSRRESMIRLQQKYARDVDWTHPHTLAPNNLLVETVRKCFPQELKGKSAVVDRLMKQTQKIKCFRYR